MKDKDSDENPKDEHSDKPQNPTEENKAAQIPQTTNDVPPIGILDNTDKDKKENLIIESPKPERNISINPNDLDFKIEFQLTKQLMKIGAGTVVAVLFVVLGWVFGEVYSINGKVNEMSGKNSPAFVIEEMNKKLDKLEEENNDLREKIHQQEIQKLSDEIQDLKGQIKKLKGN
jgi:cell division protein FtsB